MPWTIHKRRAYAPMIFLEVHPCFAGQLLSFSEFFFFLFLFRSNDYIDIVSTFSNGYLSEGPS